MAQACLAPSMLEGRRQATSTWPPQVTYSGRQQPWQREVHRPARRLLEPAERARAGHPPVAAARRLEQRVGRERGVVVEILVPARDAQDALRHHRPRLVRDVGRVARVAFRHHLRDVPDDAEPALQPREQEEPAVAADAPPPKSTFSLLAPGA